MTDHANELRRHARKIGAPAGDTPSVMAAAAAHIDAQAAEIERLQHLADQADQIDVHGIVDALSWMGVSTPEGGTEAAAARLGRLVNDLSAAVLRHKVDHRRSREEIARLSAIVEEIQGRHWPATPEQVRALLDGRCAAVRYALPMLDHITPPLAHEGDVYTASAHDIITANWAAMERRAADLEEIERLRACAPMSPATAAMGEIVMRWREQGGGLYAVDLTTCNLTSESMAHAAMAHLESLFAGDEIKGH